MFIILLAFVFGIQAIKSDERNCDHLGVLFYEELGCTPNGDTSSKCPISFDCPDYERNEKICNFQGKKYKVGQNISDEITQPNCNAACFCSGESEKANIICASVECPEIFGGQKLKPNCYRTYDNNLCCSTGESCDSSETVEKCEVEGKKYKEGERFYPKDKCLTCVCRKGFKGKFEEPYCRKISCGFEITHADELEKNCAPVYFDNADEKSLCCPYSWLCPDAKDVTFETKGKDSEKKCKFGSKQFNIGDVFRKNSTEYNSVQEVKCICNTPPYLSCTSK